MATDEIILQQGLQVNEAIGSIGAVNAYVSPGGVFEVKLFVKTDTEYERWIRIGDTFPVRDQTWKLDRVDNAEHDDWVIRLVRVE